jgi:thiamine biosynthesis lipoprotein
VHPELALALTEMRRLHRATSGAFDPAVGSLVAIWRNNDRPPANLLAATRPPTLDEALTVDGSHVTLASGVVLDAGGFGKGWALDRIAERLRAGGARAAYLDFGGSSQLAVGAPPGSPEGWIVLIAGLDAGEVLGAIRLKDAALSTSRALAAGDEAGPIVDPRTRRPVAPPRLATVLAREAATAEAWSKATIILGREGLERARREGVEGLLVDRDGVRVTDGFSLRRAEELRSLRIE